MNNKNIIPENSCDCHTHVVGSRNEYPLVKDLIYLPQEANTNDMRNFLDKNSLKRVVLVQPSFYGTDNTYLEYALKDLGNIARGVAVLDTDVSNEYLDKLHSLGVRGIRINPTTFVETNVEDAENQIKKSIRIAERNGWHIQFFLKPKNIRFLKKTISEIPFNIIFDHMGFMQETKETSEEFLFLTSLLEKGNSWIKLSAPYRLSEEGTFEKVKHLILHFKKVNQDNLVWGSDWPHTPKHDGKVTNTPEEKPYRKYNITERILELSNIINEASVFKKIMQDNPERLYEF